jgi:hypothetical protein
VTFLELCVKYRSELGIPGTGPVTTVNQTGELARVVSDIQDADLDIKKQWQDWKFLWAQFTANTIVGANWLTTLKPSMLSLWDTDSVWLDKGTVNGTKLDYVDYDEWKNNQASGEVFQDFPTDFTELPSGEIRIFPFADTVQSFTADYWKKGERLSSDSEISVIPEEYHRIIVVRAKLIYAEREDAPEIMAGASAEYDSMMSGLEASYLPGQGDGKQARVKRPRQMRIV